MADTNSSELREDPNQELDKVVQAYTNVIYLKILAFALPVMYAIGWIPGIAVVGHWGVLFLLIALPVASIVWWAKYRSVHSDDRVFKKAKRFYLVALGIWGFMLVVSMVAPFNNVAYQLRNLPKNPATIVVIKDIDDKYWVVLSSHITQVTANTVTIGKGSPVVEASLATGSPDVMVAELVKSWSSYARPLLNRSGEVWGISLARFRERSETKDGVLDYSGIFTVTEQDREVHVEEVVLSKPLE